MRTRLPLAALVLTGILAALGLTTGGSDHRLRAAFDAAHNVVPGLQVRVAGRPVGSVAATTVRDGHALLTLKISDDRVWPLRAGTTARLRYGPTAGYAVRYVELRPGPPTAVPLGQDALLPPSATDTPVEVDDLLRIMDARGRRAARAYTRSADAALAGQARPLRATVRGAAAATAAIAALATDLRRSRTALATLVSSGAHVTGVIARRSRALGDAVDGLAQTYAAVADERDAAAATLRRLPVTLARAQRTLRRADPSIDRLDRLTGDLTPAARQLQATAAPLRRTLAAVRDVAPVATGALRRTRAAEPAISRLLGAAPPLLRDLRGVLQRAAPMLACVRPYAPELAGVLSTWAGYSADYDALGHIARAELQVSPSIYNRVPLTPEQFVGLVPDTTYALPRAPGANAGQPWFQPACGATAAATDPANDPESAP